MKRRAASVVERDAFDIAAGGVGRDRDRAAKLCRSTRSTSSISSCTSAASAARATRGEDLVAVAELRATARGRCGVIGESTRSRIEIPRPYIWRADAAGAGSALSGQRNFASSALSIFIAADTTVLNCCLPRS